jgi:long-chain acyl-CoA synthetase
MQLTQFLDRNVCCDPFGTALIDDEGSLTWTELRDRVARLAGAFRALGLSPGGRVAMLAENSRRYVEFYLAAAWVGAASVPLNHRLAGAELVHVLTDSGSEILIVDDRFSPRARELSSQLPSIAHVIATGGDIPEGAHEYEALLAAHAPVEQVSVHRDDVVGIFYTGGTTGLPKGVMLTHDNFRASAWTFAIHLGIGPQSVSLCSGPLFHVSAMAALVPFLMVGGRIVVLPRFSAEAVTEAIVAHRVTVMNFVPTMVRMLLDTAAFRAADLSSVETVMFGGAPLSDSLVDELGTVMPGKSLVPAYGMTELTACITVSPLHLPASSPLLKAAGQPIVGHDVCIMGPDDTPVRTGELGEICARGPSTMKGYWNRPDLTAEVLRGGWMHTGDVGRMDDRGYVYVVDRIKDMIISGGENIYSAEVENVIAACSGVSQCAVIGLPDDYWGERVHAIIVPVAGMSVEPEAIVEHCRTRIAGYKVPRSVEIRQRPMPLSAANKILKAELRREWDVKQSTA